GASFPRFDGGDVGIGRARHSHDPLVEHAHAVLGDRPHRDLLAAGHPELAHDDHVERGVERVGDDRGDRDAATREPEHDGVGAAQRLEGGGELPPGILSIREIAHPSRMRPMAPRGETGAMRHETLQFEPVRRAIYRPQELYAEYDASRPGSWTQTLDF